MFEVVYKGYGNSIVPMRKVFAVDRDKEENKTYFLIWSFDGFEWVDADNFELA